MRDWDVKILAPGSDAAVTRVYCVASGIFNECDVLTTVRSARSASLALAASVRVSVPARWAPCQPLPKLAVFSSLACVPSVAKRPRDGLLPAHDNPLTRQRIPRRREGERSSLPHACSASCAQWRVVPGSATRSYRVSLDPAAVDFSRDSSVLPDGPADIAT